ncbi:MAG: maleylpyruvate isomerase family mycothiol-dependent enzyme [Acidobacteria bacterium]|nr:maleylpyruvate isomerase family mycothiol-dependent enzyme [Acidobacteriota bacterium]
MAYDWIIDALDDTWSKTERALTGRVERDFDALTSCPGWSVRDVVNHVTGSEFILAGAPVPVLTSPPPPYVRNRRGEENEAMVASRRHYSAGEVLNDFRYATTMTLSRLGRLDLATWEAPTRGASGWRPLHQVLEMRVIDSWIHLQDIRDALLEPTDDHGLGEDIVINYFEGLIPFIWARRVAAPEAALLRINLVGRLARSVQLRVRDGRGVAVASSDEVPTVEMTTAVALFWRRMAGRINAEALLRASATDIRGDRILGGRLAEALCVLE